MTPFWRGAGHTTNIRGTEMQVLSLLSKKIKIVKTHDGHDFW